MHKLDQLTARDIARRLGNAHHSTQDMPVLQAQHEYRQAAVLIPFVRTQNSWHLLYIRRAILDGDQHSGQVAFAGGKREKQDKDMLATALRETQEEIGVAPQDVSVLGCLAHHHSISNFRITPVVGTLNWPYPLTLQESEVGRAFTIPLHWLADERNHKLRERQLGTFNETATVPYFDEYDGELLWGATARMTLNLLTLLKD